MKNVIKEFEVAGKILKLETGKLANNASAAVVAKYGDTVVLATVCSQIAKEETDFLPLTVDYEERLYAGGRISSSRFIKREGRPSEEATLTGRLIDRSIRPLFPKEYQDPVQVIVTVLSVDQENDPDILSIIAVSAALTISDIPWDGPIAAVRIGYKDGSYIVNPTSSEMEFSDLDLVVASMQNAPVMIEAEANQVEEKIAIEGIKAAQDINNSITKEIENFAKQINKPKSQIKLEEIDQKLKTQIQKIFNNDLVPSLTASKSVNSEAWFNDAKNLILEKLETDKDLEISHKLVSKQLEKELKQHFRKQLLAGKRPDGRKKDEIREIEVEVGILPRTHGSAIFRRGETQILSIVTLGSPALQQLIEGMKGEGTKRYMHHYNFPPYSTGEVRRVTSVGRREIGHGALAERSVLPVIPAKEQFPYAIRVVSEVLSSAGSTSMGAVCGSTLALMDAGVPIRSAVAGIAIGLISDDKNNLILSDIAYAEDAYGDMDFKVAGTKKGITAIQLDIKINGLKQELIEEILERAKAGRHFILDQMLKILPDARTQLSPFAPRVAVIRIDPAKIGEVIGSGGRTINNIIAETGTAIDIEDDGLITIAAKDPQSSQKAVDWIELLTREVKAGELFEGKVKRILPFGAMVELLPGKEGLVHISQLAPYRVNKVDDIVKIGQKVKVKVTEIDEQGRINLTMMLNPQNSQDKRGSHFEKRRY